MPARLAADWKTLRKFDCTTGPPREFGKTDTDPGEAERVDEHTVAIRDLVTDTVDLAHIEEPRPALPSRFDLHSLHRIAQHPLLVHRDDEHSVE